MLRFVVLEHRFPPGHARPLHWDFMLETEAGLRTWALPIEPALQMPIAADELPLHRVDYLDYEGPVSRDRGSVHRWDSGTLRWIADEPHRVEVELAGERLRGRAVIERAIVERAIVERAAVERAVVEHGAEASQRWIFEWLET